MTVYHPAQCTEREPDGSYEDCTWCTGVMLWNGMNGRTAVPPTRAEYEALRVAGGDGPAEKPHDGSNHGQLVLGMTRRYGAAPVELRGATFDRLWATLQPGVMAGVAGNMGTTSTHLRRWDPGFGANGGRAAHEVLVIRDDESDRVWWMNPLAPASFPGEYISKAMLRAFYEGLGDVGFVYAPVGILPPDTATEDPMGLQLTFPPGAIVAGTLTIPEGANAIRVRDGERYKTVQDAKRPAVVINLLNHVAAGQGYQVDLNGDESHFINRNSVPAGSFVATVAADCAQQVADARAAEHERTRSAAIAAVEAIP